MGFKILHFSDLHYEGEGFTPQLGESLRGEFETLGQLRLAGLIKGLTTFIRQDLKICGKFFEQPRIDGEIDVLQGRKRVKSNRTDPDFVGSG